MHYVMEFMKFLVGFSLMLAVSLTLLYFTASSADASAPSSSAFLSASHPSIG